MTPEKLFTYMAAIGLGAIVAALGLGFAFRMFMALYRAAVTP